MEIKEYKEEIANLKAENAKLIVDLIEKTKEITILNSKLVFQRDIYTQLQRGFEKRKEQNKLDEEFLTKLKIAVAMERGYEYL